MVPLNSPKDLLVRWIVRIHTVEIVVAKALPVLGRAVTDRTLRDTLALLGEEMSHRCERLARLDSGPLTGEAVPASREAEILLRLMASCGEDRPDLKDLALLELAQRFESLEVSCYLMAEELAETIGERPLAEVLRTILIEKRRADAILGTVAIALMTELLRGHRPVAGREVLKRRNSRAKPRPSQSRCPQSFNPITPRSGE